MESVHGQYTRLVGGCARWGGYGIDCVKSTGSQLGYACVLTISVILFLSATHAPLFWCGLICKLLDWSALTTAICTVKPVLDFAPLNP